MELDGLPDVADLSEEEATDDQGCGTVTRGPAHLTPGAVPIGMVVDPHLGGARADQFLCYRIKRLSRTRAARIISNGDLQRGGGVALRPSSRVVAGEQLTLWRVPPDQEPGEVRLGMLWLDHELVVFDKPPDMAVHPSARYYRTTLTQVLRRRGFPLSTAADAVRVPRPAHRLDRETSGVLVCCRTEESERWWKARFLRGEVHKTYLALCEGEPAWSSRTLDMPLGVLTGGSIRIKMGEVANGQPAQTDVEVVWRGSGRTLMCCKPRTGRTHQIRAHLSLAGFPVVGDKLYGRQGDGWFARYAETGMTPELAAELAHHRHALHAAALRAGSHHFVAPWPTDLRALCPEAADAADALLREEAGGEVVCAGQWSGEKSP